MNLTMNTQGAVVLVCCMDKRHDTNLVPALKAHLGDVSFYKVTEPGGAGLLASLAERLTHESDWTVRKVKIAVEELGAQGVVLCIHGTSDADHAGCGDYKLHGFGEHYETLDASRAFSHDELRKAAQKLRAEGVTVPIKACYVTLSGHVNQTEWLELPAELEGTEALAA